MPGPRAVIRLENVSKFYKLYDSKRDRMREAFDLRRRKRHREFYALRGIDLEVRQGERLGVVGRNGAGKSTLLKILSGVIQANAGRVEVNGRVSALLELGAGLNPNLDGIQNIYFGGIMMGFSREQMKEKLDEIVSFADIGEFIRQPLRTYSTGMRARLGFALAVNVDPEILIIDEVLSVGDELFKRKCFAKMEAIMGAGCTVIYVSHNHNTVNAICQRAVLLDGGELILNGPPKTVTMQYLRLLNALPEARAAVRREVLALDRDAERKLAQARGGEAPKAKDALEREPVSGLVPFFVPGLTPRSTVVQRNHEVSLEELQLQTPAGDPVNVLVMGEEYHLFFRMRFGLDAAGVSFGVAIKTEKGVKLCNANLTGDCIPLIPSGKQATVHFFFTCNLMPGTYFVTLNAAADFCGERIVLIQVQDALVFKVQTDKKTANIGGLAYCNQSLEAKIT